MRSHVLGTVSVALLAFSSISIRTADATDVRTNDGKVYKNVTVSRTEPDGIVIVTKTGIIKLYFRELPRGIQEKYGYDPAKAEVYEAAEAEKQRRLQEMNAARTAPAAPSAIPSPAAPANEKAAQPPAVNSPSNNASIVLDKFWETSIFAGGSETRKDLARLLSSFAKANPTTGSAPSLEIYQGVTYLMPLRLAAQKLGVAGKLSSKNAIICPGFPRSSMFCYAVDGMFDGEYNRMLIVTDRADQVLSVELVAEHPTQMNSFHHWARGDQDWYCYNFIAHRVKTMPTLRVHHELNNSGRDVVRADLTLVTKNDRQRHGLDDHFKVLETSRWYVPRPLAELILYCLNKAAN